MKGLWGGRQSPPSLALIEQMPHIWAPQFLYLLKAGSEQMAPKSSLSSDILSEQHLDSKLSPHLLATPWRQDSPLALLFLSFGASGEVPGPCS